MITHTNVNHFFLPPLFFCSLFRWRRREWIIAPRRLLENHDYTGLESIARIRSDKETSQSITYFLRGPGVDQAPTGRFSIDRETGFVKIHAILDREEIATYHLKGEARYRDGSLAEKDIDLNIIVEDVNDCPPVIKARQVGSVNESSAAGTFVMKVIATDADQENTAHSRIYYSIVEESSTAGMFLINSQTGEVTVRQNTLDREKKDTYKLTVKATDMNGEGGLTGTGEIEIKILDINDNIPKLEKEWYEGRVEENTANVEVMRIKAVDMDLMYTDNWLAVFEIVSGNEAGYFTITTDPKTNEGIVMINKSLNYEEIKELNLGVVVHNKAEYNFGSTVITGASGTKSYPVKINVINQKEAPHFHPGVKVVTISEDHSSTYINKVITNYAAIDSDTLLKATNVRYAKIQDDDNWLIIDEKTADIRLNKLPDRESKFLINGTYYAKIICITTDMPAKTATGTIAIQVEDFNDHCPKLTTTTHTMCLEDNVIYATAVDEDAFPNSAPFEFTVIQGDDKGKWTVEHLNETTAILRDQANLWPGTYKVAVEVKDQQGKSCADVQMMDVVVCTCHEDTKACLSRSTSTKVFGTAGILLLLLGMLLLLLVPLLLLFCLCGGVPALGDFKAIPFDTKQQLISYHTEGQGEDKGYQEDSAQFGAAGGGVALGGLNTSTLTTENMHMYNQYRHFGRQDEMDFTVPYIYSHCVCLQKSNHAAQHQQLKDGLLVYDYEGQESPAGSVGCCSLLENDCDLAFLDDLGPKFKTLAEICQGSTLVTESVDAQVSVPPVRPVSPVRPSTHTHIHTHTETVRDRDRVNTRNTSNVASGSSTIIQEERITERGQGAATVPRVYVQDKTAIPSQTLLVQQPTMYYAATPMYVVDPKPQVVLVAGGAHQAVGQVGQVGLSQGVMHVGGLQGSQGMVLVDRQVGMGGAGQVGQGISQGTVSRSRVLVVENGSSGGEQGEHLTQGFFQTGRRSPVQGLEVKGQGLQVKTQTFSLGSRGSAESNEDFTLTATPELQGSQRVVVQRKKVSVTERNVESSTRA
uniref:Cadherin domain-containing protein n=1 Tax=Anabas testudineus TaxID=64144 RepID=A0A7N5ZWY6_ANATE